MNFINGAQLLEYCEKENKKISEAMFERETTFLEQDGEKTRARMKKAFSIMQAAVKKPLKEDIVRHGSMIGGESKKLHALREQGKNICGDVVSKAIAYAVGVLEVNASMGLIVAAPQRFLRRDPGDPLRSPGAVRLYRRRDLPGAV